MDEIDRDQEFNERMDALRIQSAATAKPQASACGRCLFCNKPLRSKVRRWCDDDCRDDWQAEQDAKARNG